ncbi:MAG: hypothetical protein CMN28_14965 [Salinisphaeraceae bacterium]|nr:hypothetical protein [Salinisphaeraceae bacterium]
MLTLENFVLLVGLAGGGLFWANAVDCRSRARRAAIRACSEADVLFCDELSLKRIRLGLGERGQPSLRREYGFEFFTSGNLRYAGTVHLRGRQIASVEMSPRPFDPSA